MIGPRIGVTVSRRSAWRVFPLIAFNVWMAGGRAMRWQTREDIDVDLADGVIIGGGDDISPKLYGGELHAEVRLDPERDALEKRIIEQAIDSGTPLLGICRGAQMLNVALGGDLHQDAYAHFGVANRKTILPQKTILPRPGTRLCEIAGADEMRVNALHSQAVNRLGDGLLASARDTSGMIQAVERILDPFALGVQWHPEHLFYARRQRRLFNALVTAASAFRAGRKQIAAVNQAFAID